MRLAQYSNRDEERTALATDWASKVIAAICYGKIGRPVHLDTVTVIRGLRTAILELEAGYEAGYVASALDKDDAAALRQTIPRGWNFKHRPRAYFHGRLLRLEVQWPTGLQDKDIQLSDVGQHPQGDGRWIAGLSETGHTVVLSLSDSTPGFLIAGTTGSGKSVAMCQAVYQLSQDPRNQFVLMDGKFGDGLNPVRGISGAVGPMAKDTDEAISAITWAAHEMKKRYTKGRDYIATCGRLVVVADEVQEFLTSERFAGLLRKIASQGRGAKVHLVIGTHHPTVDLFKDRSTRRALVGRIALLVGDRSASEVAVGNSEPRADFLTGSGDSWVVTPSGFVRTQIAYVPESTLVQMDHPPRFDHWPVVHPEDIGVEFDVGDIAKAVIVARDGAGRDRLCAETGLGSTVGRRLLRFGKDLWSELEMMGVCKNGKKTTVQEV